MEYKDSSTVWLFIRKRFWIILLAIVGGFVALFSLSRKKDSAAPPLNKLDHEPITVKLERKVVAAQVDHQIALEKKKTQSDHKRQEIEEIASEKDPFERSKKMAEWIGSNI